MSVGEGSGPGSDGLRKRQKGEDMGAHLDKLEMYERARKLMCGVADEFWQCDGE